MIINIYHTDLLFITRPRKNFSNVMIETTVDTSGADSDTAFGIVCNYADINNFYYAAIKSDGSYKILKNYNNQWELLTGNGEVTYSNLIPTNDASYRLGLRCARNQLTLYVNGALITSITESAFSSGDVGLAARSSGQSATKVRFSDFKVFKG